MAIIDRGRVPGTGEVAGVELPRCPIPWQPHALAPVFSGYRHYAPAGLLQSQAQMRLLEGVVFDPDVPTMRVWFPSLGGTPQYNEILGPCGRFPPVVFAHGQCEDTRSGVQGDDWLAQSLHYLTWADSPILRQLARAGYVVAVPQLSGGHPAQDADLVTLRRVVAWLRQQWQYASLLADSTAVIGHSRGGVQAARLASELGSRAFVSLSGDFHGASSDPAAVLRAVAAPKLFVFGGTEHDPQLLRGLDASLHVANIRKMQHFDYLLPNVMPCQVEAGPCAYAPRALADLVTMFLGRYLPAAGGDLGIPPSLQIPEGWDDGLSQQQLFYTGGYLTGMDAWAGSVAECRLELSFETKEASGTLVVPNR